MRIIIAILVAMFINSSAWSAVEGECYENALRSSMIYQDALLQCNSRSDLSLITKFNQQISNTHVSRGKYSKRVYRSLSSLFEQLLSGKHFGSTLEIRICFNSLLSQYLDLEREAMIAIKQCKQ